MRTHMHIHTNLISSSSFFQRHTTFLYTHADTHTHRAHIFNMTQCSVLMGVAGNRIEPDAHTHSSSEVLAGQQFQSHIHTHTHTVHIC